MRITQNLLIWLCFLSAIAYADDPIGELKVGEEINDFEI